MIVGMVAGIGVVKEAVGVSVSGASKGESWQAKENIPNARTPKSFDFLESNINPPKPKKL